MSELCPDLREELATADLWDLGVALNKAADTIDGSSIGWAAIQLPGLPAVSLAFLIEHLMAELDRVIGGGYRHAQ